MTEKVVGLRGHVPVVPGVPREEVVEAARHLLELAEAGEIVGLSYAALHANDQTSYCSNGIVARAVLGAVTLMQADLADHLRSED